MLPWKGEMGMVRTTVYVTKQDKADLRMMPKIASTSSILRVVVKCLTSSDKAFERWLLENPRHIDTVKYMGKAMRGKWHLFL